MALIPGARVGPYEVVSRLGAGGMGEVYRARDMKLGRDVALKILPEAFATDPDRLMRFDREARTLAALNHPQIAQVYGLEDGGCTPALVMELVEGDDLSARIARGPIPLDEALLLARQIAEALEAAHEAGIIHRDLKPANIKVRADGRVKVLDFGLAKALDPLDPQTSSAAVEPPTITSPGLTMRGVILGTAAYMAPEQAKGRPVDKRADIWAFGCVLFEMLAGRRAFEGEDITDTIAAVVSKEPDWSCLPASTPAPIRRLLRRALVKDRRNRLPDIAAARLDIDDASRPADDDRTAGLAARPRTRLLPWIAAIAAVAIGAAVAGFALAWPEPQPAGAPYRASLLIPHNINPRAPAARLALSPNGMRLAYVAAESADVRGGVLFVRALNGASAQRIPGTEGATAPFWSPDSQWIAFFADSQLKKVAVSGGPPLVVADLQRTGLQMLPGTWLPEGLIVFSLGALSSVPAGGGVPAAVTVLDAAAGETDHVYPHALPDGRVLYTAYKGLDPIATYVMRLADPSRHRVMDGGSNAQFASGSLLFVRDNTLVAQAFDPATATVRGDAVPIAESVLVNATAARGGAFSVARSGALVYQAGGFGSITLFWSTRDGRQEPLAEEPAAYRDVALSPDGRRIALVQLGEQNRADLWLLSLPRSIRSRLTFTGREQSAVWSPDATQVVFNSERDAGLSLYRKATDGSGGDEVLFADDQPKWPLSWSSDGRFILADRLDPATSNDIWLVPTDTSVAPTRLLGGPFAERWAQFSPDGRWVAYTSDENGRRDVYLTRFPGAIGRWQVSTNGGSYPRWSRDGKELFFYSPAGRITGVPVTARGDAPELGQPVPLFEAVAPDGSGRYFYDVAADGRFLMSVPSSRTRSAELTLLVNWPSLLGADAR